MQSLAIIQICALIVLLVFSISIAYWKCYKRKDVATKRPRLLDSVDVLIIVILSSIYAAISFINFGYKNLHQGAWQGIYPGRSIIIIFDKPTLVTDIYLYFGLTNGTLQISCTTEDNKEYKLNTIKTSVKYPPLFSWNQTKVISTNIKLRSITLKLESPVTEIKQIAIFNNKQYLTNFVFKTEKFPEDKLVGLISDTAPKSINPLWLSSIVFDELYYATTAYQYLHGYYPYTTVHPPLGMLIIALGILIFGMNPFGWRITSNLCGILMVPLIYIFAKKLFKSRKMAIISSLLMITDFMHFTFTRTASIDSSVTLFILLEYLFLFRYLEARQTQDQTEKYKSLFWCALCFGISAAIKWSALFSVIALIPILSYAELFTANKNPAKFGRRFIFLFTLFIIIPFCIYFLSYIPFALNTHPHNYFSFVWDIQKSAYSFHTGYALSAHSINESPWWSWPFIYRPYSIYSWMDFATRQSVSMVLMGNPAIWWFGIAALLLSIANWLKSRNLAAGFLILALIAQYLPYAFVHRVSFIYYFYTVTPILILVNTYILMLALKRPEKSIKIFVYLYLLLVIALFIAFFPALAGIELNRDYVYKYLLWYKNWQF